MIQPMFFTTATLMFLMGLYFTLMIKKLGPTKKKNYILLPLIPFWACVAYIIMGFDLFTLNLNGGQFYIVRYLDWMVTTPLILFFLAKVALFATDTKMKKIISTLVALDVFMIITGVIASFFDGTAMFFWFGVSSIAYIAMIYLIFTTLKKSADKKSATVSQLFKRLSILIVTIWSLYPIIWLLSIEGYGIITLNSQVGIFAVLDLFAKGVFGYLILQDEEALEQTAPATK